jgi:hypothetical protein
VVDGVAGTVEQAGGAVQDAVEEVDSTVDEATGGNILP